MHSPSYTSSFFLEKCLAASLEPDICFVHYEKPNLTPNQLCLLLPHLELVMNIITIVCTLGFCESLSFPVLPNCNSISLSNSTAFYLKESLPPGLFKERDYPAPLPWLLYNFAVMNGRFQRIVIEEKIFFLLLDEEIFQLSYFFWFGWPIKNELAKFHSSMMEKIWKVAHLQWQIDCE